MKGSGELIISLCTHTIGIRLETQQAWDTRGCHKGDSDPLLRSVSLKLGREGHANLIFLCMHTVGCAKHTSWLGGESHSITRQMQPILPPMGGSELVALWRIPQRIHSSSNSDGWGLPLSDQQGMFQSCWDQCLCVRSNCQKQNAEQFLKEANLVKQSL